MIARPHLDHRMLLQILARFLEIANATDEANRA
jgi:hypothetical protein